MNYGLRSLQGVTHWSRGKAFEGVTLFTPAFGPGDVWLIDMEGRVVHQWVMPNLPGEYGKLTSNGNLLYGCRIPNGPLDEFGGSFAKLIEVDWDGSTVWQHDDLYMSHDFFRMKNGNTMVIRWVPMPDDVTKKVKGGIPGSEREGIMWSDALREIDPDGRIVWEWTAYEHMDPELDVLCPLCGRARWANANSVFVMDNGDVVLSQRFTNSVIIVDRKTGDIRWRWGPGEIAHQHDAQVLDNGNILLYDNGLHRLCPNDFVSTHSQVVEVEPSSKAIVWRYRDESPMDFYSFACSGAQRLPNGNTLICQSFGARIFEVTYTGDVVWEYIPPFYYSHPELGWSNFVFRAYRYACDGVELGGRELRGVTKVSSNSDGMAVEKRSKLLGY
ncbi:aryl-sulfate sulfotransferase [Chloroflexota bacterium]